MKWEIVIGLETHTQLSTASKIFSGSSTAFGAAPNAQANAVDIALPGVLPVLNKGAVERAIRFGLAVGGNINRRSVFARKNYFYPDLPKGYQISQYELPIVQGGSLTVMVGDTEKTIRLTRAHLEEDAGKSIHGGWGNAKWGETVWDAPTDFTAIDLNRAGTPLLEIVSEPEMRSAEEAVAYAKTLHSLVRWIGICDGNMQEGSFRCDANVSVRPQGADKLGTRCEIKNLNSFRFLEQAIEFEVRRQIELLENGGTVVQETRLYDPDKDETRMMRSKEDAMDYRYFPDPDLPPLEVSAKWIEDVRRSLPELPAEKHRKFTELGLTSANASVITSSIELTTFFEATANEINVSAFPGIFKTIGNATTGELMALLNEANLDISKIPITPQEWARLQTRIADGTISTKIAKELLKLIFEGHGTVDDLIEKRGLRQISDVGAIEKTVDQVIMANPKSVEEFKAGKEKAFNALVGQVMKAMQGKANPAQVNELLKKKLGG